MQIDELRNFCLSLNFVTEDCPFGPETLVFRVGPKIFALTSLDTDPPRVNLKADPEYSLQLREQHSAIVPGFHMNKKHWNTLIMSQLPNNLIEKLVIHSYELVFNSLSKKEKEMLIN